MTLKRNARLLFAFSFAAVFGCLLIESESHAQRFRRPPGQELGRFLGFGYGNGYHCRTPGPQADYYNPYGPTNSHLVSRYQNSGRFSNMNTGYAVGGFNRGGTVPHSEYTGTQSDGYSVFENLPGQTVTPSFEPVPERKSTLRRDLEERDFEDELDLDEDTQEENEFRTRLQDDQESPINREQEDAESDGGFDSLKENFDGLNSESDSSIGALQPSDEDQAAFFGGN